MGIDYTTIGIIPAPLSSDKYPDIDGFDSQAERRFFLKLADKMITKAVFLRTAGLSKEYQILEEVDYKGHHEIMLKIHDIYKTWHGIGAAPNDKLEKFGSRTNLPLAKRLKIMVFGL